ncbi:low molecular weight phosphatase family protein [Nanoarchaeota archaeon]
MKKMNILFVCKYNRFRSKIAEAYLNLKSEKDGAKSAGIIEGNPISDAIFESAKRNGLEIRGAPRTIDVPLLKWHDKMVIIACDIPASLFHENEKYGRDVEVWPIEDCDESDTKAMDGIIVDIKKRIDELLENI